MSKLAYSLSQVSSSNPDLANTSLPAINGPSLTSGPTTEPGSLTLPDLQLPSPRHTFPHNSSQSRSAKREHSVSKKSRPRKRIKRESSGHIARGPTSIADVGDNLSTESMALKGENQQEAGARRTGGSSGKPKRVRTGCLTCRERHLKCDEGVPTCLNCRKSGRECKRGVRLNFIDTQCQAPPHVPSPEDWSITFQDDSREIASEYQDGLARYAGVDQDTNAQMDDPMTYDLPDGIPNAPALAHQSLPSIQGLGPAGDQGNNANHYLEQARQQLPVHTQSQSQDLHAQESSQFRDASMLAQSQSYDQQAGYGEPAADEQQGPRDLLNNAEETLYMQVFVEEVGAWMDAMDSMKHVRFTPLPANTQLILTHYDSSHASCLSMPSGNPCF